MQHSQTVFIKNSIYIHISKIECNDPKNKSDVSLFEEKTSVLIVNYRMNRQVLDSMKRCFVTSHYAASVKWRVL